MPINPNVFLAWSSHTGDLLNYCDFMDYCMNYFLHYNCNSWTNHRCKFARLLLND